MTAGDRKGTRVVFLMVRERWRTGASCLTAMAVMLSVVWSGTMAQTPGYAPPLDGVLRLSGNFGEVRTDHFHSGLDLKTGGVEGSPVRTIADGWVSRVSVSPTGYGKALYVDHGDGHTSVYGHLRAFQGEVAEYVRRHQFDQESFAMDLEIPDRRFAVKRGHVIALSGNSGSSGGPHLHFEVRQTDGQVPLNPLRFGFPVRDDRPPMFERLWLYCHGETGHVQGAPRESMVELERTADGYRLKGRTELRALGPVSVGVAALDRFSDSENACGIYRMTVRVDTTMIHRHVIDRNPFETRRHVNAHIDLDKRQRYRDIVLRSYIAPGNRLPIYVSVVDRGVFHVAEGQRREVRIDLEDFAGNVSTLVFPVVGERWKTPVNRYADDPQDIFLPDRENSFSTDDLRLTVPSGRLYDTLRFIYITAPPCKGCLTSVHEVGRSNMPLDDHVNISIRLDGRLKADRSKLVMVSLDGQGRPSSLGGKVNGQWLAARTRSFGRFSVMADTLAPVILPKNFREGRSTAALDTLTFHIEDDLSGIASYRATLNGQWVLLEYDPKNRLAYYVKDAHFLPSDNLLEIEVTDNVGNKAKLRVVVR